jgi:hypothetical protein
MIVTNDMINRGAEEVRAALRQLEEGRVEAIMPGSLAEDVIRAALSERRCDGCGNKISRGVEPWTFPSGHVTHPNHRCADVAEGRLP